MDTVDLWRLAGVALLVGANGFFVAAEFALVSVRKTRIEQLVLEGHGSAKAVRSALNHLDRYIAGTQVGITLASLALGWIGEPALARLVEPVFGLFDVGLSATAKHSISVALSFTVITFLHVILGELVPKSVALQMPEATSLALARPLSAVVKLFQPLIWSLNGLGNLLLKCFGLKATAGHDAVHSAQELELLVGQSHRAGVLDDLERKMIQRTFRFSERTVSEIMVPRSEMAALDLSRSLNEVLDRAAELKRSRLPVYRSTIDQIDGVVFIHDLFRLVQRGQTDIAPLIRKPLYIPESLHLDQMIERFRGENIQIAIVIDEHGGTAGLVTLEDVVEAVFGRIQDYNEDPIHEQLFAADGSIMVRGDARLNELTESFGWLFPDGDADTIAGYFMDCFGGVPKVGDEIVAMNLHLRVTKMNRIRILEIVIRPAKK